MIPDNNQYYKNIIGSIPDGLAVVSASLVIQTLNSAMEELTDFSLLPNKDHKITDLFPEESDVMRLIKKTLMDGLTHSILDYTYINTSKMISFPTSVVISPLLDEKGNVNGTVILMRDIRRMRELEEDLKRVEKLSLVGSLAVGMAHEIKNPLSGIRGAAQLLMEEIGHTEYEEYLNVITKESDRVNSIVEQLLDFTRIAPMNLISMNIHKILDHIIRLLEKEMLDKKIRLVREYDPSLPHIIGDSDRLTQVFLNLVMNGIESMPEGGDLVLTTKVSYNYSLVLDKKKKTYMGLVEIRDSGTGFSKETINKIFTPFFTTKTKGTGLGLAISYKIIEEHAGKISLGNRTDNICGGLARVFLPLRVRSQKAR